MTALARCSYDLLQISRLRNCNHLLIKRFRYKKKWAVNSPQKLPSELALDHFDIFYRPVFQRLWPSIRVSLLSLPKYCAVVNNFAEADEVVSKLSELGTVDLIHQANMKYLKILEEEKRASGQQNIGQNLDPHLETGYDSNDEDGKDKIESHLNKYTTDKLGLAESDMRRPSADSEFTLNWNERAREADSGSAKTDNQSARDGTEKNADMENLLRPTDMTSDLNQFVPVSRVLSEREELRQEELESSSYTPHDLPLPILPPNHFPLRLPTSLRIQAFPRSNVSSFPPPKSDASRKLGYYLMDGASCLPIIALDLDTNCTVLDLCAAPGGKTLAMLQTLLPSHVTSNDVSKGRLQRLRETMRWYGCLDWSRLTITARNGLSYTQPDFDRVLVDVPCNSDRHVLLEDDNSLFKPGRVRERLALPLLQKELLLAGLKSCKPGGVVVYSTCTLAPSQNDGVVQTAVEELQLQAADLQVAVHDLSTMAAAFSQTFTFHKTRFGHLVLPSLTANFGPMYICKICRTK